VSNRLNKINTNRRSFSDYDCFFYYITLSVSFSGQWYDAVIWEMIFIYSIADFIQEVWVLPSVFLYLSSHGFSLKMRECDYKCYACCQRSCRKHSLQKNGLCLYTGDACSPLSLKKRMINFFKKASQNARYHFLWHISTPLLPLREK